MENHKAAKDLIEEAEDVLCSENKPDISELFHLIDALKDSLKEYVWLREQSEK